MSSPSSFGLAPNSVTSRTREGRAGIGGSAVQELVPGGGAASAGGGASPGGGVSSGGGASTGGGGSGGFEPSGGGAPNGGCDGGFSVGGSASATGSEPPPPHPAVKTAADRQSENSVRKRTGIGPLHKLPAASCFFSSALLLPLRTNCTYFVQKALQQELRHCPRGLELTSTRDVGVFGPPDGRLGRARKRKDALFTDCAHHHRARAVTRRYR